MNGESDKKKMLVQIAARFTHTKDWGEDEELIHAFDVLISNIDKINGNDIDIVANILSAVRHISSSRGDAEMRIRTMDMINRLNDKYGLEDINLSMGMDGSLSYMEEIKHYNQLEEYMNASEMGKRYLKIEDALYYSSVLYVLQSRTVASLAPIELANNYREGTKAAEGMLKILKREIENGNGDITLMPRMMLTVNLVNSIIKLLNAKTPEDALKYNDELCDYIVQTDPYLSLEEAMQP